MFILKISGSEIDQPDFLKDLAVTVKAMNTPMIIVHGGGKEISQLQDKFGITPQYIDGLRVTDDISLALVKMVLCGAVNPRIVETLQHEGLAAQGLSGLDRGLLQAKKMQHPDGDLGWVGEITAVRGEILHDLVEKKVIPVIAPICLGQDGAYNVNADHVACAVGIEMAAESVVFLTNVQGVMKGNHMIDYLDEERAEQLIEEGVIKKGMIPKVRSALDAVRGGVKQVVITSLIGLRYNIGTKVQKG